MTPTPPRPYRVTNYALPTAPLAYARRLSTPDGAELATFIYGTPREEATPVLLLHGNGSSHATFAAVIDKLVDAGLYVVALDARAQGQSSRGTAPLTYEQLAADALFVLDYLGIRTAHILGHSDGGIEALLLARDHAGRVASIVACGANLTPEGVVDEWDTPGSVRAARAWVQTVESNALPSCIDPTLLPNAHQTALDAELLQLMLDEPHIDPTSLATISCPTCVLVGENDCITREETEAIATHIPDARLVTVPGIGHAVPRLAPDTCALQVLTNVLLSQTH